MSEISRHIRVAELLEQVPELAEVFLQWKLGCVGCSLSSFCTLVEVAEDYQLDLKDFLAALEHHTHTIQTGRSSFKHESR